MIETQYDEAVTPYTSAFLSGPDVTNIPLQAHCSLDGDDHLAISFDAIAMRDVLNALDPADAVPPDAPLQRRLTPGCRDVAVPCSRPTG